MTQVILHDNMNYMKEITTTKNGMVTVEIYRKNLSNGLWYRTCKSTKNEQDYNIEKKKYCKWVKEALDFSRAVQGN